MTMHYTIYYTPKLILKVLTNPKLHKFIIKTDISRLSVRNSKSAEFRDDTVVWGSHLKTMPASLYLLISQAGGLNLKNT